MQPVDGELDLERFGTVERAIVAADTGGHHLRREYAHAKGSERMHGAVTCGIGACKSRRGIAAVGTRGTEPDVKHVGTQSFGAHA